MARLQTDIQMARSQKGFTLIELLIAVLIIAILATLVTLGVSKAMSYAKQVATKTEMAQIEQALGVAAIEMGRVPFIPSYLVLFPRLSDYDSYNGLDKPYADMSKRILSQMFPKWATRLQDNTYPPASWGARKLTADKSYIFFLRGFEGNGFSTGQDPWSGGAGKRFGPYFEFKSNRLEPQSDPFPSYKDYWDNPNSLLVVYSQLMVGQSTPPPLEAPINFPSRLKQTQNKYFMPKGYQILSAGKDGIWGKYPTGPFTGGPSIFPSGDPGEDDQSNFADEPHGKPVAD